MKKTTKLGLSLYDSNDKFSITAENDSLNHNMEILDQAISEKKTPYEYAKDGGYQGTEAEFIEKLTKEYLTEEAAEEMISNQLGGLNFTVKENGIVSISINS